MTDFANPRQSQVGKKHSQRVTEVPSSFLITAFQMFGKQKLPQDKIL